MFLFFFFFLMIRRPPRSTLSSSSAASDVYKRQVVQGQDGLQYVQVGSYFVPITSPQGQSLVAPQQMQQALTQDLRQVQNSYGNQGYGGRQVMYAQPMHGGCHGGGKMKKMKGYKNKKSKGYKIKLF
eukprot:TRINITY_DN8753_c0_g1_i2.p1 TRINITY_DN8753_c0_g1~~TRINITY_DN8753_c0_g1_i2.p1  ORF type:complete len:127 (+),score=45.40 TRINITY_DN8753_c0_g1_i2:89-469(+)